MSMNICIAMQSRLKMDVPGEVMALSEPKQKWWDENKVAGVNRRW